MNNTTEIGRKLRELRLARGWSLLELSAASGVSKSWVSEVERGNRLQPRKGFLLAVARALEVDPVYLLDDSLTSIFTVFKSSGAEMPEDVREFLSHTDAAYAWVRLAAKLDAEHLRPDTIEALVAALRGVSAREHTTVSKDVD